MDRRTNAQKREQAQAHVLASQNKVLNLEQQLKEARALLALSEATLIRLDRASPAAAPGMETDE